MAIDSADNSDARLPDDLKFLAEQLAEDAEHLGATYPANAPQNWRRAFAAAVVQRTEPPRVGNRSAKTVKFRPAVLGGLAAAAAVAFVALTWYAVDQRGPADSAGSPAMAGRARVVDGPNEHVITSGVDVFPFSGFGDPFFRNTTDPRPTFVLPPGAKPVDYFSAPEQEAVIDLMNRNRIREPSIPY